MSTRWFADASARRAHAILKAALEPVLVKIFPGLELSHAGFNRDFVTEEIRVVLHFNPIGRVRVVPDPPEFGQFLEHRP